MDGGAPAPDGRAGAGPVERRWELDWLRVIGMGLVFLIHASEPFNPWDSWHVQNAERSKLLGEAIVLLAPWVMPLFMLLAGTGAWFALERRPPRAYARDRVLRVLVPLALGTLLLVPPQVYLERRQRGQFAGSFAEFLPRFFDGIYPQGNFTWLHLWFLAHLALYSLLTLPLLVALRGARGRAAMRRIGAWASPPGAILLLALPLLALRALAWVAAPSRFVYLDWSSRVILLPTFVLGFLLAGEPALQRAVDRQWRLALAVALVFALGMGIWVWPGQVLDRLPPPLSPAYVALWSAYTLGAWAWVVALLGAARRFLDFPTERLARARRMVGPFYMLHQTIVVIAAFQVVRFALPVPAKFALLAAVALALTIAGCELAGRWRPARLVLGFPDEARRAAPAAGSARRRA